MERLQKLLASAGVASRRAAERLIAEGRVTVNGRAVTRLGVRVDPQADAIKVDGRRVLPRVRAPTYLMLHKPPGYLTTMSDPQGRPTVPDLLRGVKARVFPIGRLDFNSEGLLLMTDDGELARDLMHPRSAVPRTYRVKVRGVPSERALQRISRGLVIDRRRTLPARIRLAGGSRNAWVEVTVTEGRKHHVRRLLSAVGHPVVRLRRTAFGGVLLGRLPAGRFRPLTPREVERLRTAAGAASRGRRNP